MIPIAKHPFLIFGIGLIGGAWIYKNRQALLEGANKAFDSGKSVIPEQKEKNLNLAEEAEDKN